MIDLNTYTSGVHKIKFKEGDLFIKELSGAVGWRCEDIENDGEKIFQTVFNSLCDELRKPSGITLETVKGLDVSMIKTIYLECVKLNGPKKKLD